MYAMIFYTVHGDRGFTLNMDKEIQNINLYRWDSKEIHKKLSKSWCTEILKGIGASISLYLSSWWIIVIHVRINYVWEKYSMSWNLNKSSEKTTTLTWVFDWRILLTTGTVMICTWESSSNETNRSKCEIWTEVQREPHVRNSCECRSRFYLVNSMPCVRQIWDHSHTMPSDDVPTLQRQLYSGRGEHSILLMALN